MEKKIICTFAAACIVKNECDIIELFIKINARVFDKIFILDHISSDGTVLIIKKLIDDGYPVELIMLGDIEFNQSKIITNIVRKISKNNNYDYIMPIDADEFLYADDLLNIKKNIIKNIEKDKYALVRWVTYCPVKPDYFSFDAPLFENFKARKVEPKQYYKVILGGEYAKKCIISAGNHSAKNYKYKCTPCELNLLLQHVPIRSKEQLLRKSLIGYYARTLRTNKKPGDSYHFKQMIDNIRNNNYNVSFDKVYDSAIKYAAPSGFELVENSLDESLPLVGNINDKIVYKDFSKINITNDLDCYISDLVTKLKLSHRFKLKSLFFRLYTDQKQLFRYVYSKFR
ncbi:MAG: glycosyltransferase family 2 protein [Candidatus Paceibacterota bacterium]